MDLEGHISLMRLERSDEKDKEDSVNERILGRRARLSDY